MQVRGGQQIYKLINLKKIFIMSLILHKVFIKPSSCFSILKLTGSTIANHQPPKSSCYPNKASKLSSLSASSTHHKEQLLQALEKDSIVTSTKSKTVKLYQSISSKAKIRNELQLTIIEGHRLIIDTLKQKSSRRLYNDVLVSYEALNHPQLGECLSKELNDLLLSNNDSQHCRIRLAEQTVINAASDTVTPQGVVALVGIPNPYSFSAEEKSLTESSNGNGNKKTKFYLILDGISDPGNVGTLIRSAKATGIEAILLLPNCCDVFNPKAVRSAMGSTFHVPICSFKSWDECYNVMSNFHVQGSEIFAATMEGSENYKSENGVQFESIPYYDINWHNPNSGGKALIIGKEGTGLSEPVCQAFSCGDIRTVHVPMEPGIESLNAAVCGSIIMFEYLRQSKLN